MPHKHWHSLSGCLTLTALVWWGGFAWAAPLAPSSSTATLASSDSAQEEEILVQMLARQFMPSTVTVHAGRHTKLIFQNQDSELHAFVPGNLFAGVNLNVSGNGAPEFGDDGLRRIIIPPAGRAEIRFVLEHPGQYPFLCDMPGHDMRATIVVE